MLLLQLYITTLLLVLLLYYYSYLIQGKGAFCAFCVVHRFRNIYYAVFFFCLMKVYDCHDLYTVYQPIKIIVRGV